MKVLLTLVVAFFGAVAAYSTCYEYAPMGGYPITADGFPPEEDKNCHETTAEMDAETAEADMPRCLESGHFDFYQCQGSECWCTDCAGHKIVGFENFERIEDPSKCVCARKKHEFSRSGMVGVSHRCEKEGGHYSSYQCSGTMCYCTDKHGASISTDVEDAYFHPWNSEGKDEFCSTLGAKRK